MQYVRTSEELYEASDDDEYESGQLGVREDVLYARRPLDVIGVDGRQQRCKQQPISSVLIDTGKLIFIAQPKRLTPPPAHPAP